MIPYSIMSTHPLKDIFSAEMSRFSTKDLSNELKYDDLAYSDF